MPERFRYVMSAGEGRADFIIIDNELQRSRTFRVTIDLHRGGITIHVDDVITLIPDSDTTVFIKALED